MNGCRFWRLAQSGKWRMETTDRIPALPTPWAIEALWTARQGLTLYRGEEYVGIRKRAHDIQDQEEARPEKQKRRVQDGTRKGKTRHEKSRIANCGQGMHARP